MSEAHSGDPAQAPASGGAVPERDAKIEQLLLVGLDHYFVGRYDQAINVWTRALFLDRSHPRARAYIERARTALAEAQRESEELLQSGVAAFDRGEGDEARRLLLTALDRGAPPDEALAVLGRLNRLEAAVPPAAARSPRTASYVGAPPRTRISRRTLAWMGVATVVLAAAVYTLVSTGLDWQWLLLSDEGPAAAATAPVPHDTMLPLPRRGEMAFARARALAAAGRLRDALTALDGVRLTDPERADADRLRSDIQHQLLDLANVPRDEREKAGRPAR
jgi:tetratricopeptide (TPR) repeat protein